MKKMMTIKDQNEWEMIKKDSTGFRQVVLFKYSPRCAGSQLSRYMFERWFGKLNENEKIICAKINVIDSRKLSNSIAEEFSVEHESPQVIWLDLNGSLKWHNSHFLITEDALTTLLN
ncbi:MAG: bacillithiol system redox-active protein YtxJ [Ignavibacteriaceae bacterium]